MGTSHAWQLPDIQVPRVRATPSLSNTPSPWAHSTVSILPILIRSGQKCTWHDSLVGNTISSRHRPTTRRHHHNVSKVHRHNRHTYQQHTYPHHISPAPTIQNVATTLTKHATQHHNITITSRQRLLPLGTCHKRIWMGRTRRSGHSRHSPQTTGSPLVHSLNTGTHLQHLDP